MRKSILEIRKSRVESKSRVGRVRQGVNNEKEYRINRNVEKVKRVKSRVKSKSKVGRNSRVARVRQGVNNESAIAA